MKVITLLVALLVLSSCASTPQSKLIRTSPPDFLPVAVELVNTPFYPQTDYQCGPAALATLLEFHGVETSLDELSRQIYIPGRKGSLQIEVAVAARQHEMLPYTLAPNMLDIFTEIAAGNPVLVLQNLSFEWYPQWHYAVVVGYDIDRQEITLRSGTTRRWTTPFKVFERTWQRANFWALAMVPVGQIPKTAKPLPYLKTAYAFEETGYPELALKAYRSASLQWPDVVDTWLTLGNMLLHTQNWSEAVQAFSTAIRLDAGSLISWNNLAYALHGYGCTAQAKRALQCGLETAPDDENLLDSWRELSAPSVNSDHAECPLIQCE